MGPVHMKISSHKTGLGLKNDYVRKYEDPACITDIKGKGVCTLKVTALQIYTLYCAGFE